MFYRKTRQQRELATDPTRFHSRKRTELSTASRAPAATSRQLAGGRAKRSAAAAIASLVTPRPKGPPAAPELPDDSPWRLDPSHFPHTGSPSDKLRFCLRFAVLAPSSHNTQPWRFKVEQSIVHILADRARALPVCDPDDRELTISVGCAIHHFLTAAKAFGVPLKFKEWPDPANHDLAAAAKVTGAAMPDPEAQRLVHAALIRRTVRRPFDDQPVAAPVLKELTEAARAQGATLELVAEADLVQFCNRPFRRELAMWMHHNRTHAHDGIPGFAMGLREIESLAAPLVVRTFDMGKGRAAKDEELALHSPVLAVLGTDADTPAAWLAAGRALSATLLTAVRQGLGASYLNQPVEIPETRMRLKHLAPRAGWPQIVLRLGYPLPGPLNHTPRRPLDEVLIKPPGVGKSKKPKT